MEFYEAVQSNIPIKQFCTCVRYQKRPKKSYVQIHLEQSINQIKDQKHNNI